MHCTPAARKARRLAIAVGLTMGFFVLSTVISTSTVAAAVFAKYDGIEGESKVDKYTGWIEVEQMDWGAVAPPTTVDGARRRGGAIPEEMTIMFGYDKAAPKILEACLQGKVIPKLEIELTFANGEDRATYLRYEFRNVLCSRYSVSGPQSETGNGRPVVIVQNVFEELTVTYKEYDGRGAGEDVEVRWDVETRTTR